MGGAGRRGADEARQRVHLRHLARPAGQCTHQRHAEHALGVADGARRPVAARHLDPGCRQARQDRVLGQQDPRDRDGCLVPLPGVAGCGYNCRAVVVEHAQAPRADGQQLGGHRRQQAADLLIERDEVSRHLAVGLEQLCQARSPGGGLATEAEDVGLARLQEVGHAGCRGRGGLGRAGGVARRIGLRAGRGHGVLAGGAGCQGAEGTERGWWLTVAGHGWCSFLTAARCHAS